MDRLFTQERSCNRPIFRIFHTVHLDQSQIEIQIGEHANHPGAFPDLAIGAWVFIPNESLDSISLPQTLVKLDSAAFFGSGLRTVALPESLVKIEANPFSGCANLTEIQVLPCHPVFALVDGVLYHRIERRFTAYPPCLNSTTYSVRAGTLAIGSSAFDKCLNLRSVTLPEELPH